MFSELHHITAIKLSLPIVSPYPSQSAVDTKVFSVFIELYMIDCEVAS